MAPPPPPAVPTLFVDEELLVVSKPAGIAVIPGRTEGPADALRGRLEADRGEKLWVVHRIDRDTSGVVVFARNAASHRALSQAFEHRQVAKRYDAFTRGRPETETIDLPLHEARKGRMRPAKPGEPGALESQTSVEVVAYREALGGVVAHVRASPRTGRQHQIRVHLRAAGAPLLVDPLYGPHERLEIAALGPGSPEVPRLTLHAASLTFEHPTRHVPVTFDAPLPPDLAPLDAWIKAG